MSKKSSTFALDFEKNTDFSLLYEIVRSVCCRDTVQGEPARMRNNIY